MKRYSMKRVCSLLLALVLLLGLFSGCEGASAAASPELTTVRFRSTGETIAIGYTREEVEKVTGSDINGGWDFLEENMVGDFYWDAPGIRVDYLEDVVMRLLIVETTDWELMNGLYVGMPKAEAEALYENVAEREIGTSGGIMISYDENFNPIAYNEFAPYVLTIGFTEEDMVELAYIEHILQ